ncbi:MAG: T9SS type A sorting domain-containing protein [Bacteroidota bacterium]
MWTKLVTTKQLLLWSLLTFPQFLAAQDLQPPIQQNGTAKASYADFEHNLFQWQQQHDLDQTKGWKWLYRWMNETNIRLNPGGEIPDQTTYFQSLVRVADQKQQSQSRMANWAPVGPIEVPPSNNALIVGLGRINTISFHPTDPNTFWVGVSQGGVWKTTNNGQSWQPLTDDLPILRISDIAVNQANPDEMYISVGDYAYLAVALNLDDRKRNTHYGLGVYKTINGGQSWTPTGLTFQQTELDGSLTRRVFIHPSNSNNLIAAGIHGIWTSADAGDTWSQQSDSLIWDLEQDPQNPDILYASTGYLHNLQAGVAGIMKSTDFGQNWSWLNTGIPQTGQVQRVELSVSPSNPQVIYAVTCNINRGLYAVYRSINGGQTWTQQANSPNILNWWLQPSNDRGQGTYDLAVTVHPTNPDIVYVGGINLWASTDGGVNWNPASYWRSDFGPSLHADQHYMEFSPHDGKLYACNDGGIYRTDSLIPFDANQTNNPGFQIPTSWENLNDGLQITAYYRLGLNDNDPSTLLAGAQDNSTYLKSGNSWVAVIGGDGMECLQHPTNSNILYGSYQFGNFARSDDGGNFFQFGLTDAILANELGAWTTPMVMSPNDNQTLYAGYSNVWKSTNQGDSWQKVSDFSPMPAYFAASPASALAVAPSDEQSIYVAKRIYHSFNQPSQMFRTTSGGNSWQEITFGLPDSLYFTYIAVDDDDPLNVYLSVGGLVDGQKVFHSTNGGDSWNNISLNLPNLPVNCLVHQAGSISNIVYAGTDVGVYVYSDSLGQWELYSDQLPNVIVSELDIHPLEQKIYAATFGRGIWVGDLFTETPLTGIPGENFADIQLSPNPAQGQFSLSFSDVKAGELKLDILDVRGRRMYQESFTAQTASFQKVVQINAPSGLYFVRIQQSGRQWVERLILD